MNHAANTSWLSSRQLLARAASPQLPVVALPQYSRAWDRTLSAIALIPSWVYLAMVIVAALAICLTVNLRGHGQLRSAELQFHQMESEISALRRANASLATEVLRITSQPATIESAARSRLGMVRPTDVVVPLQSRSGTNLAALSFVR